MHKGIATVLQVEAMNDELRMTNDEYCHGYFYSSFVTRHFEP
jgi:hypothetical protein